MGNNDDSISRRKFLEQASVAVGAAALGNACSSDETGPEQPMSEPGAGTGGAGQSSAAGTGTAGSTPGGGGTGGRAAGSPPASGTGGSRAGAAGSGGRPSGSAGAGTGGSGGAEGAAGMPGSGGTPATGGSGGTMNTPPSGKVTVGIVKRANIEDAVARAIELAGGLNVIKPGQTVFIKPNAVSDRALDMPGIRTSNAVLAAVVKLVKARMPGKITVGDRSARTFPDTARILMATGMREAAMAAGADEVYAAKSPLDAPEEWMLLKPPLSEVDWPSGMYAMKKILEADHLINVPACKNHHYALYSLSMKAFMGGIGDSTRDKVHFNDSIAGNFTAIGRDLAIINQMFKPTMNIIDATTALVNGGPEGDGRNAVRTSPGMIFASKDRIAVDAAAVSLIQLELETATVPMPDAANATLKRDAAWKLPQIVNGIERGIGVGSASMVELMFDGVDRAAMIEAKFRA